MMIPSGQVGNIHIVSTPTFLFTPLNRTSMLPLLVTSARHTAGSLGRQQFTPAVTDLSPSTTPSLALAPGPL